jgi:hypothetical protein
MVNTTLVAGFVALGASDAAASRYYDTRVTTAGETSPWVGMDACTGAAAELFAVGNGADGPVGLALGRHEPCRITLFSGAAGSTITIVGNSNGPGGSDSVNFENLHTKTVGSE